MKLKIEKQTNNDDIMIIYHVFSVNYVDFPIFFFIRFIACIVIFV